MTRDGGYGKNWEKGNLSSPIFHDFCILKYLVSITIYSSYLPF